MTTDIHDLVTTSCTLPPMPAVASRVMQELMNPDASADSLSKIIETDQALVTRVLKIANSAFYGCSRKVSSIQLAIVVLGFNTMKNLVIATSTKSLYHHQSAAEQSLWEHSLAVGVASHVFAIAFCPGHLEEAFTAGLLHDLGKLVLYMKEAARYTAILDKQKDGVACHVGEREVYGFTHADVGAILANRWNLPESFERTTGLHHALDSEAFKQLKPQTKKLVALIALANGVAKQVLMPTEEGTKAPVDGMDIAMETLGVTEDRVEGFLAMIKETLDAEKGLFEV